jgi:hypothetical protein
LKLGSYMYSLLETQPQVHNCIDILQVGKNHSHSLISIAQLCWRLMPYNKLLHDQAPATLQSPWAVFIAEDLRDELLSTLIAFKR